MSELPEGTVTILFTDAQGSTDLGARSGDESARAILRRHEEVLRSHLSEYGGLEVKALGDGFMVVFSSTRKAISCAVAIQRSLEEERRRFPDGVLPVRMGLNAGEVIKEGDDLFGSSVSAAARIAAKADGGEILVSDVVKALAGTLDGIAFKDRNLVQLKGFEDRWRLHEVVWRKESPAGPGKTPFVARENERSELNALVADLTRNRGSLVMIGGEPGVGKTRLAEEIAAEAKRRSFRVLTGRCYEMDSPSPYLPFIELLEAAANDVDRDTFRLALGDTAGEVAKVMPQLRNLFDDLPPPLEIPPEQERRYLFNSISEFVVRASSARPLVVILDDLHWADESSLLLLEHVAQRLASIPVLIMGTYRDVELDSQRPLARSLDNLVRRRLARRMSLRRLPADAVRTMLTELAGSPPPGHLADAIFAETEGNAFFVEEVFQHLSEEGRLFDEAGNWKTDLLITELEVPEGVRLVIGRRLERLSETAQQVLTVAAVIGRVFTFDLLEAAARVDGDDLLDAIDEACRSRLTVSVTDRGRAEFSFAHELIRQTLLSRVTLPRRQRIHLRVAEAMEEATQGGISESAPDIAHHFFQAGSAADSRKTIHFMGLAGERAMEAAAYKDALHYYEEALELVESDQEKRADLLFDVGLAQRSLGHLDAGIDSWREALELYESAGNLEAVARVTPEIVLQLGWAARWGEAFEMAGRGLIVVPDQPTRDRGRLLALSAVVVSSGGDYASGEKLIGEAKAIAEELDDDHLMGECLLVESVHAYSFWQSQRACEVGTRGSPLLKESGDLWNYATGLGFIMFPALYVPAFDLVERTMKELEPLAQRLGHIASLMFVNRCRTFAEVGNGVSLDEWDDFAQRDLELNERGGLPFIAHSYAFLAWKPMHLGDWETAENYLQKAADLDPPGALWGWGSAYLFQCRCYAGKTDQVLDLWTELREHLPEPGRVNTTGRWSILFYGIEALALLDRHDEVAALYPVMLEGLDVGSSARFDGRPLELYAAIAAASAKEFEKAEAHFESALRFCDRYGDALRPDVEHFQARMLLRRAANGDKEKARELLSSSLAGYEKHNWGLYANSVRALILETD